MTITTLDSPPRRVGFAAFDADNHYYEATDAFTRYQPPDLRNRGVRWATIDGRERLLVGGRINRFIPNPTFDPVARPGALDTYFRGQKAVSDMREAFGELEPINPAYREPDARLKLMDEQGLGGCFLFPTLGVGIEQSLAQDPQACVASFQAFNQWLRDDWGFAYAQRIYAAPYLTLVDPAQAVAEVRWALEEGAKIFVMRAGPILIDDHLVSPGDDRLDRVWGLLAEAGVTVAYHSGDSGYGRYSADWGVARDMEAFRYDPFSSITQADRAIFDTVAALVCHNVLSKYPRLRIASIESGSTWVHGLLAKLKKADAQVPQAFNVDPVEQLRDQLWVSPYYEDNFESLREDLGVEQILFGSDYPHAEGLAVPTSYVDELKAFNDKEIQLIMHDNAHKLATPLGP